MCPPQQQHCGVERRPGLLASVSLTAKPASCSTIVTERRVSLTDTTFSVAADGDVTCEPHCKCADNICRTTSDQVCVIIDGVRSADMCGSLHNRPIVSVPPNADRAVPSVVAAGVSTNVIVNERLRQPQGPRLPRQWHCQNARAFSNAPQAVSLMLPRASDLGVTTAARRAFPHQSHLAGPRGNARVVLSIAAIMTLSDR